MGEQVPGSQVCNLGMCAPALRGDEVHARGRPGQGQPSRGRFPGCFAPSAASFSVLAHLPSGGDCSSPFLGICYLSLSLCVSVLPSLSFCPSPLPLLPGTAAACLKD